METASKFILDINNKYINIFKKIFIRANIISQYISFVVFITCENRALMNLIKC